jgi:hypothetical protein
MTTTVVKTIGTGGDYSTLQAWEDAAPANLVTSDQIWEGQLKNQTFSSGSGPILTISGSTTDATRFKRLTCQAGASFRDNAGVQSNALRYNTANGAAITCSDNYNPCVSIAEANAVISGLQIENTSTAQNAVLIGATPVTIDNCILEAVGVPLSANGFITIRNSLVVKRGTNASFDIVSGQGRIECYNSTFAVPSDKTAASVGVDVSYPSGTSVLENVAIFGATDAYHNAGTTTITTCRTNQASPETGFTGGVSYSGTTFVATTDAARDFRLPSGSSLINAGTTDSTNAANDIAGTARPSGASYDVGAWEYVAAGGTTPITRDCRAGTGGMRDMCGGMRG